MCRRAAAALDSAALSERSAAIIARLLSLAEIAPAQAAVLFVASGPEPDLSDLWPRLRSKRCEVFLPRVNWTRGVMDAARAPDTGAADLVRGRFGLLEPGPDAEVIVSSKLDIIVLPGVAFDQQGGRLGRGGGHYDRFLARAGDRPLRIGVCFDEVLLGADIARARNLPDLVPTEPHDQRMDVVITPTCTLRIARLVAPAPAAESPDTTRDE